MKQEDIAIIGVAGVFPDACDLNKFWENLVNEKCSIKPLPESRIKELEHVFGYYSSNAVQNGYLDSIGNFDASFFNISEEEAKFIDPQQRMSLEVIQKAIEDAGYSIESLADFKVGTFMAHSKNQYGENTSRYPLGVVNSLDGAMAGRVAFSFNFTGPALTIDTTCSSFMVALHYACMSLKANECDYAIVGGFNVFALPQVWDNMKDYPIFSHSEKIFAFDERADGTLGGEGGGALLLKKASDAIQDGDAIHCIIKGTAINSDAKRCSGLSAPSSIAQTEVIREAIKNAGILPDSISYIETHGTGTKLGDPIEVKALNDVFEKKAEKTPIGTVKTNIGHLVGMAGFAGLVKVLLCLKYRKIPASVNFEIPNSLIDFANSNVFVNQDLMEWNASPPLCAGVSSFGIIGTNVHVILEEYVQQEKNIFVERVPKNHIFLFSGKTEKALMQIIEKCKSFLKEDNNTDLANIAYTLAIGRDHHKFRYSVLASDKEELLKKLESVSVNPILDVGKTVLVVPPLDFILRMMELNKSDYINKLISYEEKKNENGILLVYNFIKIIQELNIPFGGIYGIGSGKIISDLINNRISIDDLNSKLYNNEEYNKLDFDKIQTSILNMQVKGYSRFIQINSSSDINQIIKNCISDNNSLTILNFSYQSLLNSLASFYLQGVNINWNKLYINGINKRIHLPTYPFDSKSYFLINKMDDRIHEENERTSKSTLINQENVNHYKNADLYIESLFIKNLGNESLIDLNRSFSENGGDSITMMQIIEQLKSDFNISLSLNMFYEKESVVEIIEVINTAIRENCELGNIDIECSSLKDELLNIIRRNTNENLDIYKNYNENGGDSISIMQIVDYIKNIYSVDVPINDFYESENISILINNICCKIRNALNLNCDKILMSSVKKKTSNIFLTGATGFFGANLLYEIIKNTESKVYCLIRGENLKSIHRHACTVWQYYFDDTFIDLIDKRIFIISGDISLSNLGIEDELYLNICNIIDIVIHSAATVKQYGKYADFYNINVKGTENIVKFCLREKYKELHHCSSYVVSGNNFGNKKFDENDVNPDMINSNHYYAKTKFEAELVIKKFINSHNLKANIYRLGNLIARSDNGKCQFNINDNAIYTCVKALTILKSYTKDIYNSELEMSSVDIVANKFLCLMLSNNQNKVFHLIGQNRIPISAWITAMNCNGVEIVEVDNNTFEEKINKYENMKEYSNYIKKFVFYFRQNRGEFKIKSMETEYGFELTNKELDLLNYVNRKVSGKEIHKAVEYLLKKKL